MSDVGERMLAELRRIREALEGAQPLGFGKRQEPAYVFVKLERRGSETTLWYRRDKREGTNHPIYERDVTGYLANVWRFDRLDEATGERVPRLNVQLRADKDYVIQTGFQTNFAKSFMAGLLELPPADLREPLTLVLETNEGSRHRPTVFCRLESRGARLTPDLSRASDPEALYASLKRTFGFSDPYVDTKAGTKADTGTGPRADPRTGARTEAER